MNINKKIVAGEFNITTVYIGWLNKWLNSGDVKDLLGQEAFMANHNDILINLYINDFSEDYLKAQFPSIVDVFVLENSFSLNDLLDKERKRWEYYCLKYTYENMTFSIKQKLELLAGFWEDLGYPNAWRDFIYYMPAKDVTKIGNDYVYEYFKTYYEKIKFDFN